VAVPHVRLLRYTRRETAYVDSWYFYYF